VTWTTPDGCPEGWCAGCSLEIEFWRKTGRSLKAVQDQPETMAHLYGLVVDRKRKRQDLAERFMRWKGMGEGMEGGRVLADMSFPQRPNPA
jgi:hypothetical protein